MGTIFLIVYLIGIPVSYVVFRKHITSCGSWTKGDRIVGLILSTTSLFIIIALLLNKLADNEEDASW